MTAIGDIVLYFPLLSELTDMMMDCPIDLASFPMNLISADRIVFSRDEAATALGISAGALLDAAERLQRGNHIVRLRQGFYVVVPPQYLSWGALPFSC